MIATIEDLVRVLRGLRVVEGRTANVTTDDFLGRRSARERRYLQNLLEVLS